MKYIPEEIIEFKDDNGTRVYDATRPFNVFGACLIEFLEANNKGVFVDDPNPEKVSLILELFHGFNFYRAGKVAYHFMKNHHKILFKIKKFKHCNPFIINEI